MNKSASSSSSSRSSSSMAEIERTSSIEKEPRTLKIDFAREAAMYVVNTRSVEEATKIFTEGLEPVVSCGRDREETVRAEEIECSANSVHISDLRDIVSAPF